MAFQSVHPSRNFFNKEVRLDGGSGLSYCYYFFLQVTLNNYTFENVAFHVLHQRFPMYSPRTLSDWFDHNTDLYRFVSILNTLHLKKCVCVLMIFKITQLILGRFLFESA